MTDALGADETADAADEQELARSALMDQARQAGIEGRSTTTKDELGEAVARS